MIPVIIRIHSDHYSDAHITYIATWHCKPKHFSHIQDIFRLIQCKKTPRELLAKSQTSELSSTLNLLRLSRRSWTDLSLCKHTHENSFTIARLPRQHTQKSFSKRCFFTCKQLFEITKGNYRVWYWLHNL